MHAETCWIKSVQMETYEHEIRKKQLGGTTPLVKQFNLFIDENKILCCEGRIHHSIVAETAKRPILLPTIGVVCKKIERKEREGTTTTSMSSE